jgi:hypothetical protein
MISFLAFLVSGVIIDGLSLKTSFSNASRYASLFMFSGVISLF